VDYGGILKRAWVITLRYKSLWLFGLLSAIFGGGGNYNFNLRWQLQPDEFSWSKTSIEKFLPFLERFPLWPLLIFICLFILIIIALSIFVNYLSQAALIGMVRDVEFEHKIDVGQGFKYGLSRWFPLLEITLGIWIPWIFMAILLLGITLLPAIFAFAFKEKALGFFFLISGLLFLIIILIPSSISLTILDFFAGRYCVIENLGVLESIKRGYHLLRENIGRMLIFWLVMFGVGIGIGIILLLVFMIFAIPVALATEVSLFLAILITIPGIFVSLFVASLVRVFLSSAWTIAFLQLFKKPLPEA